MTDENKTYYLSKEKYEEFKEEKEELEEEKIPEIADKIDEAKQMGDLSENASYKAAREEMAWAKTRIQELTEILDNAEVVEKKENATEIDLGTTFTVEVNGNKREYELVGSQEADPADRKISNESPLGAAFMGKEEGDEVEVEIPAGKQTYKIIEIK